MEFRTEHVIFGMPLRNPVGNIQEEVSKKVGVRLGLEVKSGESCAPKFYQGHVRRGSTELKEQMDLRKVENACERGGVVRKIRI